MCARRDSFGAERDPRHHDRCGQAHASTMLTWPLSPLKSDWPCKRVKVLGGTFGEMIDSLLKPSDVMVLRASARLYKKLELGVCGLALLLKKQVMEGPLWQMISLLLALDGAVKLRTAAKME